MSLLERTKGTIRIVAEHFLSTKKPSLERIPSDELQKVFEAAPGNADMQFALMRQKILMEGGKDLSLAEYEAIWDIYNKKHNM